LTGGPAWESAKIAKASRFLHPARLRKGSLPSIKRNEFAPISGVCVPAPATIRLFGKPRERIGEFVIGLIAL